MKSPTEVMAAHCLETIDPDFVSNVRQAILSARVRISGWARPVNKRRNLGLSRCGSRIGTFVRRHFYRNAINHGLMALVCAATHSFWASCID